MIASISSYQRVEGNGSKSCEGGKNEIRGGANDNGQTKKRTIYFTASNARAPIIANKQGQGNQCQQTLNILIMS